MITGVWKYRGKSTKYGFETGDLAGGRFTYYSNRNLDPDDGIVINTGAVGQVVRDGL